MLSERVIGILADSFLKILIPGLTVTIPLTVISFALAMVIAIAVALIQFAKVRIKEIHYARPADNRPGAGVDPSAARPASYSRSPQPP